MTAPAQSPAPEAMAGFADPSAVGGTRPATRDLVGRVVIVRPTSYNPTAPGYTPGTTQERVTLDVMVVTGGPVEFGGNPRRGKPNTLRAATPYFATGLFVSNSNIVAATREFVGKSVVLGRVTEGVASDPKNENPFNLMKITPDEPEYGQAVALWTQYLNGQFLNPVPVSIGAAPAIPQVAQPAQAQAAVPAVDPNAAFAAFMAEQQRLAAAAAQPAAPADETIAKRPSNWQADIWAGLTREQRVQVLAAAPF